jgi:hypothetical protein
MVFETAFFLVKRSARTTSRLLTKCDFWTKLLTKAYFGRCFYYQPTLRRLFWECAPGQLWPLNWQAEFTRVFELPIPSLDRPLLDDAAAPRALANAND